MKAVAIVLASMFATVIAVRAFELAKILREIFK